VLVFSNSPRTLRLVLGGVIRADGGGRRKYALGHFRGLTLSAIPLFAPENSLRSDTLHMAKASTILEWCIVRLGEDHNWWVQEVSDPVRWDADGLSIVDPRQVAHLLELVDPLRDYGFDQDVFRGRLHPLSDRGRTSAAGACV